MSIPLCIDGRLVEFKMALFDESDQAELEPELKQRTFRIALDLDSLGEIDLTARVVNRHINIDLLAASAGVVETLAAVMVCSEEPRQHWAGWWRACATALRLVLAMIR